MFTIQLVEYTPPTHTHKSPLKVFNTKSLIQKEATSTKGKKEISKLPKALLRNHNTAAKAWYGMH